MKLFNETLNNIFSNFIPNKTKTFRESNPLWLNDDIKNKVNLKHKPYHRYLKHQKNNEDFAKLEGLQNEIDNLISKSKNEYFQKINRKLNNENFFQWQESSCSSSESDDIKILRPLEPNKTHNYDPILVRMIKLCTNFAAHQLYLIFENSLVASTFTTQCNRANIVPI